MTIVKHVLMSICVGAAVTVAVAWAIALFGGTDGPRAIGSRQSNGAFWQSERRTSFGTVWLKSERLLIRDGITYSDRGEDPQILLRERPELYRSSPDLLTSGYYREVRRWRGNGFPRVAMWVELGYAVSGTDVELISRFNRGGLRVRFPFRGERVERVLPCIPALVPFIINTGCYAAAVGLGCAGLMAIRRHVRVIRGCCPICNYLIGTNDVCTECGYRRDLPPKS